MPSSESAATQLRAGTQYALAKVAVQEGLAFIRAEYPRVGVQRLKKAGERLDVTTPDLCPFSVASGLEYHHALDRHSMEDGRAEQLGFHWPRGTDPAIRSLAWRDTVANLR